MKVTILFLLSIAVVYLLLGWITKACGETFGDLGCHEDLSDKND